MRGDHPRSRGVYPGENGSGNKNAGSSPLARGLLSGEMPVLNAARIIPARAGFTRYRICVLGRTWDHPRSRGVYGEGRAPGWDNDGSSPLARGLQEHCGLVLVPSGIIPARAGFTATRRRHRRAGRDHPRSRGVYISLGLGSSEAPGSSPLARGLQHRPRRQHGTPGIIPARAGFTASRSIRPHGHEDHPRSRGVYAARDAGRGDDSGSSPLARGLRLEHRGDLAIHRIIPARAGFTARTSTILSSVWDHPRSRGVYESAASEFCLDWGSSPLARGLLYGLDVSVEWNRIIPARAGFTASECCLPVPHGDHPRSRGVYTWRSLESQRSLTLPDGFRLHC